MKNQKIVILGAEKDGNDTADGEWENRANPLATNWKTPIQDLETASQRDSGLKCALKDD